MYITLSHRQAIDIFMDVRHMNYDKADVMVEFIENCEEIDDTDLEIDPIAWCSYYRVYNTHKEAEKDGFSKNNDFAYRASNGLVIYNIR